MAVEKMKYVNIVGNKDYLDEFIDKYLTGELGLQPEYALSALRNVKHLYAYKGANEATDLIKQAEGILQTLGLEAAPCLVSEEIKRMGTEALGTVLREIQDKITDIRNRKSEAESFIEDRREAVSRMELISDTEVDLQEVFHLRYFKMRIGKVPKAIYSLLTTYTKELDVIMLHIKSDGEYEHLIYIMPASCEVKVDGVFNSLQFDRCMIPEGFEGTPREVIEKIHGEIAEKEKEISRLSAALTELAQEKKNLLFQIYTVLLERDRTYEIRKYVAFNKDSFYLVGWLPASSLKKAKQKIDKDPNVVIVVDSPREIGIKPPTKLKNFCLFRPFEMIVRMYGLPAYNELDPTPLVAILYCLLAGIMFGDVGQGLIFVLAGAILWFKKKSPLGGVFIGGGISAMIFGFLYGSIFSYEDVLEPIFMNPMEDANINTMLMLGIAVGVVLLVLCMVLNIINGIKAKDKGRVLFDRNGVAGLVFYTVIIATVVSLFFGGKLWLSGGLLVMALLIPFVIIFFKHPLENFLNKKKPVMPEKKGGFIIETVFEMVDMLLGFASNTISFVRISAFAINHVGLSMAVMILADMGTGFAHVAIVIFGNFLVIVLEGMIVGIQGLRLVYYELFSRFYKGDGRPYTPLGSEMVSAKKGKGWS